LGTASSFFLVAASLMRCFALSERAGYKLF
jgi:hypothetical protein